MGVPLNHLFYVRIFHETIQLLGYPQGPLCRESPGASPSSVNFNASHSVGSFLGGVDWEFKRVF